jgi:hypothetical protein
MGTGGVPGAGGRGGIELPGGVGGASGPGGSPLQGVAWVTANSVATGDQDNAAVAAVRTGYVAVVWEDDRDEAGPEDDLHSEIFLRLYLHGTTVYEVKLSDGGSGDWRHVQPDVALYDDGRAVVVWAEDTDGNGYYNIQVRLVGTGGAVEGSARAHVAVDGQQRHPAVAAASDGAGFAVVWEDEQTGTPPTVRVAGFSSIGAKSYEEQVHTPGGTHRLPDVAMGAAGNAIVVWEEDGDGNGMFDVGRKVFTPSGGVKQAQGVANASASGQRRRPAVAANFNGDFAVAWETDQSGVFASAVRSFTAIGQARSTADTLLRGNFPQVGIDDEQRVVVASVEAFDVYVQGLNADGTLAGRLPRLLLGQTTIGRQDEPALATDPWGRVALVYTDDNDGNLFDQVILGTGLANSVW